jgi:predicted enzyme related to lactoylglutathione lyase
VHRSTLGAFSIDVPTADMERSTAFWSATLSRPSRVGTQHPEFRVLEGRVAGLEGIIQDVGSTPARVHLDVHTDDVSAEVARLVDLGATEVARHGVWVVLEDPSGMEFCVCPVAADDPVLDGAPSYGD